jgi:hypothetical protein
MTDLFKDLPDIIDERSRHTDTVQYRYSKEKLLGKVRYSCEHQTPTNLTVCLCQGGFAQVYLGTKMHDQGRIAIKIVAKASLVKTRAKQKVCKHTINNHHSVCLC